MHGAVSPLKAINTVHPIDAARNRQQLHRGRRTDHSHSKSTPITVPKQWYSAAGMKHSADPVHIPSSCTSWRQKAERTGPHRGWERRWGQLSPSGDTILHERHPNTPEPARGAPERCKPKHPLGAGTASRRRWHTVPSHGSQSVLAASCRTAAAPCATHDPARLIRF